MNNFEENSIGWQLRLLGQRVGEWLEFQLSFVPEAEGVTIPEWLEALARAIFWAVVALLIVWGIWRLVLLLNPYLYRWHRQRRQGRTLNETIASELTPAVWLARSQTFRQQGDYREACLCLYQAMLQQLHDRGIAADLASRTDGEYLRLIGQLPQSDPYQMLLITHQRLCFGNAEASSQLFEQCQQAYQAIETHS